MSESVSAQSEKPTTEAQSSVHQSEQKMQRLDLKQATAEAKLDQILQKVERSTTEGNSSALDHVLELDL